MKFIIKKTTELSNIEKKELLDLFNYVFNQERTMSEFEHQYCQNPLGYSIHSIAIDEGKMVATVTRMPAYYIVENKKVLGLCAVDVAVLKKYRDFFTFYDTTIAVTDYSRRNGYAFVFGFPNDQAYAVNKKAKMGKDIGELDTYFMPYRIGGVKRSLKVFNIFSQVFSAIYINIFARGGDNALLEYKIRKEDKSYNETRYLRLDANYNEVNYDGAHFYYKVKNHEGVRTAFLIDVVGKSESNFRKAVRYIYKKEKQNVDLLLYVGSLPKDFSIGLFKIPRKYEPKHFHFTGLVLDKKQVSPEIFYDIKNWDVNLSNYDII